MTQPTAHSILSKRDQITLDNGMTLRLLSALEVLQARREASELVQEELEYALCANACLLARALGDLEGQPIFSHGQDVLAGLRVEEISALTQSWSQFNQSENCGLHMNPEQMEELKKN